METGSKNSNPTAITLMRVVHLSYVSNPQYTDPQSWLNRIDFFTGILEASCTYGPVDSVHCIGYSGVLDHHDVAYHFFRKTRLQLLFPYTLHTYIKNLSPDVVIVHSLNFPQNILLLRWQLGSKVRIVVQHHAEKPLRYFKRLFQRAADRFIYAYLFTARDIGMDWFDQRLICDRSKIKEVMETSTSLYPIEREKARVVTNVEGNPVYLWVGRLNNNKDPLTVVQAFLRFSENHRGAKLYMIYQTEELLTDIGAILRENNEGGRSVHLIGKVEHDKVIDWFSSADFYISASHYEGGGVALTEAMACGCIPIVSSIPSFNAMTGGGQCGLTFQPSNANELYESFLKSTRINVKQEKEMTLTFFKNRLSFMAIAKTIYSYLV
ncbi:MAG TPA: glycosyltransferase family 4 protein [Saprospiraceae bacterium]|nr:glycosyltransferase family 4 protein [Saprospiraceae bacterium]